LPSAKTGDIIYTFKLDLVAGILQGVSKSGLFSG